MRKTRLLTLLLLLMTAVTGAWADDSYLYLDGSGTSVTLMYGENVDNNPYYDDYYETWRKEGYPWDDKNAIESITVDASCQNYTGTTLSTLFFGFENLKTITNTENLNTSSVTNMSYMFTSCGELTTLDLSSWNTSQVEDMESMFIGCSYLTTLNLSGWDTSQVGNMGSMFESCSNLTHIYVGTNWSTENVAIGTAMFSGCVKLPNYDGESLNNASKAYVGDGGYLTSNMKTIYCKMKYDWWTADGAAIGIYTWDENGQENAAWPGERMELVDGETNIWKFNLDVAKYKCCIFTRVNGGDGAIDYWGAKTNDQVIPTDNKNLFTISNSTEAWDGDNKKCDGEWSKYDAPKFLIIGSMTDWETKIKVSTDSYTDFFPAGKYQFKVIDNGNWKGIDDMTEVAGGLYKDQDGNVCFILEYEGYVTINYKSGELFTVEGDFAAPTVALAGTMNGWSATANVFTPAADLKSASVTINIGQEYSYFKVVRADEWLSKENGGGSYRIHFDWNWVDGLARDVEAPIELQANEVNKDYTFTYEYATGKLIVTFPGQKAITIDDGNKDTDNWVTSPAEQYSGRPVILIYKGKKKVKSITIEAAP